MLKLINALRRDEAGFIVSAELVLISTIAVLGMVVGLSELSSNINHELEDVGSAFGSINQTFCYRASQSCKGKATGSEFNDCKDDCDSQDITGSCPQPEHGKGW